MRFKKSYRPQEVGIVFLLLLGLIACGENSTSGSALVTSPPVALTVDQLVETAQKVISPSGSICDTFQPKLYPPYSPAHCPYTRRLKDWIIYLYKKVIPTTFKPSSNMIDDVVVVGGLFHYYPIVAPGVNCSSRGEAYIPAVTPTGGIVTLVDCGAASVSASTAWQRLVILTVNGTPEVDDILVDASHSGRFQSVYGLAR